MSGVVGVRLVTLRNALVVLGGLYLSSWIAMPFWPPILRLTTDRVYHPGWESVWINSLQLLPALLGAAIAGVAVGLALQTRHPQLWALVLAVPMAVLRWTSFTWHISPQLGDRARQASAALVPAAAAALAIWLGSRWRMGWNDRETTKPAA